MLWSRLNWSDRMISDKRQTSPWKRSPFGLRSKTDHHLTTDWNIDSGRKRKVRFGEDTIAKQTRPPTGSLSSTFDRRFGGTQSHLVQTVVQWVKGPQSANDGLANRRLQPLGHPSVCGKPHTKGLLRASDQARGVRMTRTKRDSAEQSATRSTKVFATDVPAMLTVGSGARQHGALPGPVDPGGFHARSHRS